jgi:hypothetical protein
MSAISYPQVVQKLFTNPHEGKKLAEFLMTNRNTRENDVQKALNTNYADRIAYNSRVTLNGSDDVTKGTSDYLVPIVSILTVSTLALYLYKSKH